ncbi:hypothetical protein T484DRAFT_1824322 [Baffinella frigidus]|nr:hypothetical protein T484DRAFT_1824322 [Cryptophyta sp. CCMP2293]
MCHVIQITKAAWRAFCVENPDALLLFIRLAIGRLYRVSHFMLAEFLSIPEFAHTLSHPDVLLLDDPAFPERAEIGPSSILVWLSHPDVLLLDDAAFPERAEQVAAMFAPGGGGDVRAWGCPGDESEGVAAMFAPGGALGTTVVPVAKGTVLHRPGEPSNEIFVLISGSEWERERHGNEGVCMATPTQLRAVEAGVTISGPGILGFRAFSTATDQRHLSGR